jgi:hypothetical protein
VIQRLSFLVSFLVYLENNELATRLDVAKVIGGMWKDKQSTLSRSTLRGGVA